MIDLLTEFFHHQKTKSRPHLDIETSPQSHIYRNVLENIPDGGCRWQRTPTILASRGLSLSLIRTMPAPADMELGTERDLAQLPLTDDLSFSWTSWQNHHHPFSLNAKPAKLDDAQFVLLNQAGRTIDLYAAKHGYLSLLEWSFEKKTNLLSDIMMNQSAAVAAEFGQTECLDFILSKIICRSPIVIMGAIKGGQLGTLKKLILEWPSEPSPLAMAQSVAQSITIDLDLLATHNRNHSDNVHEKLLETTNNCIVSNFNSNSLMELMMNQAAATAAEFGQTECLYFILPKIVNQSPIITAGAAKGGQLEILKELVSNGCPLDARANGYAAYNGYLSIIEYLHELGTAWNVCAMEQAGRGGHIPILDWLLDVKEEDIAGEELERISQHVINFAPNPVETLRWMIEELDLPLYDNNIMAIGEQGDISVAVMLLDLNSEVKQSCFREVDENIGNYMMYGAATRGKIKFIEWGRSLKIPLEWNDQFMICAAKNNHLEILKFARSADPPCKWSPKVTAIAAEHGHFKILKWLLANKCPFDAMTPYGAAFNNHLEILEWMMQAKPACHSFATMENHDRSSKFPNLVSMDRGFATTSELCSDRLFLWKKPIPQDLLNCTTEQFNENGRCISGSFTYPIGVDSYPKEEEHDGRMTVSEYLNLIKNLEEGGPSNCNYFGDTHLQLLHFMEEYYDSLQSGPVREADSVNKFDTLMKLLATKQGTTYEGVNYFGGLIYRLSRSKSKFIPLKEDEKYDIDDAWHDVGSAHTSSGQSQDDLKDIMMVKLL
jgi:hypothetical protein